MRNREFWELKEYKNPIFFLSLFEPSFIHLRDYYYSPYILEGYTGHIFALFSPQSNVKFILAEDSYEKYQPKIKVIIGKDIEVNGTENLVKILRNEIKVVTIFLRVPKEELRKRLLERTENPNIDEIELRLSRFDYEESKMNMYDYVIKNNDLEKTLAIIMTIINKENELENAEF